MNVTLMGQRVLLAINPPELQSQRIQGYRKGKVVKIGPDVAHCSVGTLVFVPEPEATVITFNGKEYMVVLEDDILCTVTP